MLKKYNGFFIGHPLLKRFIQGALIGYFFAAPLIMILSDYGHGCLSINEQYTLLQNIVLVILRVWQFKYKLWSLLFSLVAACIFTLLNYFQEKALKTEKEKVTILTKSLKKESVALKEKRLLLKEIQHRIRNNTQSILSLIDLKINELNPEEDILKTIKYRIFMMDLIHTEVFAQTNFTKVNIKLVIYNLFTQIRIFYQDSTRLQFKTKMHAVYFSADKSILICNLILEVLFGYIEQIPANTPEQIISFILKKQQKHIIQIKIQLPDIYHSDSDPLRRALIEDYIIRLKGEITMDTSTGIHYIIALSAQPNL